MEAKHAADTEPTYPNPNTLIEKLTLPAPLFGKSSDRKLQLGEQSAAADL